MGQFLSEVKISGVAKTPFRAIFQASCILYRFGTSWFLLIVDINYSKNRVSTTVLSSLFMLSPHPLWFTDFSGIEASKVVVENKITYRCFTTSKVKRQVKMMLAK